MGLRSRVQATRFLGVRALPASVTPRLGGTRRVRLRDREAGTDLDDGFP